MTGKRRITSLDEFAASDRPLKRTADSEPSSSVPFSQAAGARDATVQQLSRLLDLTPLVDYGEIQNRFDEIAELLLRGFHLQVTRSSPDATAWTADYEILELEFYLWKARCHEDPFTHGSDEQRRSGRWYFHRPPSRSNTAVSYDTASNHKRGMSTTGGGYRGGTRKGLDLTFGCPVQAEIGTTSRYFSAVTIADTRRSENLTSVQDEVRGGILLRTLRRLSDGKIISGPSLLVDEILRASNASTIASLVADKWGDDTLAWSAVAHSQTRISSLELTPIPTSDTPKREKPQMYTSPRIGLDLSHSSIPSPTVDMQKALGHPRITFVSRPYRYFIHPELLTSNGRGHTFLGAYNFVVKSSEKKLSEQILKESVINSTGLKMSSVRKYMEEYAAGVLCGKEGRIAAFIGSKGKGAGSSPTTALRMFGALDGVTGVPLA